MTSLTRRGAWLLTLSMVACGAPTPQEPRAPVAEALPAACMPAQSPPTIVEPSFELAHLLPRTQQIVRSERVVRLGDVAVPHASGFPVIVERRAVPAIAWRPTSADAVAPPARVAAPFDRLVRATLELHRIDARAAGADADRAACMDDVCKRCLRDEASALADGRARSVEDVLGAATLIDRELRASSPDDADAQLVWATSLEARAAAVEAPNERATLLAEALFTFERAGRRAQGPARAWLLYGAARLADAIGDDAHVASVTDRGPALVRALVAAILQAAPPSWMRVEALYRATLPTTREARRGATMRATSMQPAPSTFGESPAFDAATLRDAALLPEADEALSRAQAGLRIAWARAAVRDGNVDEAVRALVPLWRRADRSDFTPDAEPVLVDALELLAPFAGPTLGLVDADTFGRVALELGTRAAMHFDAELARTAWTALRSEASDTLSYPGALRGLALLSRNDEDSARRLRAELVALGERDGEGQVASAWSRAVRARLPAVDAASLDEAVRDGTVAVRLAHSWESGAKRRVLALLDACHGGAAKGPPLELEIDSSGTTSVIGEFDWRYNAPADAARSLRACLVAHGPAFFRTLGQPVRATVYPKLPRKSRRG